MVPYEFIGSTHVSHDLPAWAGMAGKTRNASSLWPRRCATCLVRLGRSALTFAEYPADEGNRLVARVVNGAEKVRAERVGRRRGVTGHMVVTGVAGLIRWHLTERLLADEHAVVGNASHGLGTVPLRFFAVYGPTGPPASTSRPASRPRDRDLR